MSKLKPGVSRRKNRLKARRAIFDDPEHGSNPSYNPGKVGKFNYHVMHRPGSQNPRKR